MSHSTLLFLVVLYFSFLANGQIQLVSPDLFISGHELQLNTHANSSAEDGCFSRTPNSTQYLTMMLGVPVQSSVTTIGIRFFWTSEQGPPTNLTQTVFFYGTESTYIWIGAVSDRLTTSYVIIKKNSSFFVTPVYHWYFVPGSWNTFTISFNDTSLYLENEYCFNYPDEVLCGGQYTYQFNEGLDFSSIGDGPGTFCTIGWTDLAQVRAEIANQTGFALAPLAGRIDEIRFYNKDVEELDMFVRSTVVDWDSEAGLVALWPISEASGDIITDVIGGKTFSIVDNNNCLQSQLGNQCPPPSISTSISLESGESLNLTVSSVGEVEWNLDMEIAPEIDLCVANSSSCTVPQNGQLFAASTVFVFTPSRTACGTNLTSYISSNLTQNKISVKIDSLLFDLAVNETSLAVPLSGGIFQLTGNFGASASSLDGSAEFTLLLYNHNELASSQIPSLVNTSGLFVTIPAGYGTAVLMIRMCQQTVNASVVYPAPLISNVEETKAKNFRITGQNFPTTKVWNANDVTFKDHSGFSAPCTVSTVTETSIECSLASSVDSGKVNVQVTVGDQKAQFTFTQNGGKSSDNVGVIVGPIVAGVVVISALAAFFIYRRKQQKKEQSPEPLEMEAQNTTISNHNSKIVDKWNIDFKELSIQKQIGKGGFGVIYLAKWRNTDCVVKQLERTNAMEEFLKEANNVRQLRPHPNICTVLGVCTSPEHPLCLVMEYVPLGSLWSMLAHGQLKPDEKMIIDFALDIANGMNHLHAENIIHCDLACRNVLMAAKSSYSYMLKITDFGLSRVLDSDMYKASDNSVFPVRWAAPELMEKRLITKALDVWAFGITLWEMIEVKLPYYELSSNSDVIKAVCGGTRLQRPLHSIPDSLWHMMETCWAENPTHRPSFIEICAMLNQIKSGYDTVGQNGSNTVTYFSVPEANTTYCNTNDGTYTQNTGMYGVATPIDAQK